MFYCQRCGNRFGAEAASSALVCPYCRTEDAVFAPFTSWAFDIDKRSDFEGDHSKEDSATRSEEPEPHQAEAAS